MARFRIGDRVALLAKYASLYPCPTGLVCKVNPHTLRELFDEYEVTFAAGIVEIVHSFQAIEDFSAWPVVAAAVRRRAGTKPDRTRGKAETDRILFETPDCEIDLRLSQEGNSRCAFGQVIDRTPSNLAIPAEARIMKNELAVDWMDLTLLGEFAFSSIPPDATSIEIASRQLQRRIQVPFPENEIVGNARVGPESEPGGSATAP